MYLCQNIKITLLETTKLHKILHPVPLTDKTIKSGFDLKASLELRRPLCLQVSKKVQEPLLVKIKSLLDLNICCVLGPEEGNQDRAPRAQPRPDLVWGGASVPLIQRGGGAETIHQSFPRLGNVDTLASAPTCSCVFPSRCRCRYLARFPSSNSERGGKKTKYAEGIYIILLVYVN